ncbi:hypothetical protein C8F04DRAFT_1342897 [Mycena alexandri]|uniref:DUF6589 domain-containing protein n=1 Tax=Mycena alexandri TaxID=1745969 RepID=A0AAD6RWZ8_9AGAR|nr:hypothetical protein C8F04DRAFT_1342897 [Mycena alexandri]
MAENSLPSTLGREKGMKKPLQVNQNEVGLPARVPPSRLSQLPQNYNSFFTSLPKPSGPLLPPQRPTLTPQRSLPRLQSTISAFQSQFTAPAFNPSAFPKTAYDSFTSRVPHNPSSALPSGIHHSSLATPSTSSPAPVIPALDFSIDPLPSWTDIGAPDEAATPLLPPVSNPESPVLPPASKSEIPVLPPVSTAEKIELILKMLRKARISPMDVLLASLEKPTYATAFHADDTATKFLDIIHEDDRGRRTLEEWFSPRALDFVCTQITSEADTMLKVLGTHKNVADIKPEFLRSWSLKKNVAEPADKHAPNLVRLLRCALSTKESLEKNKKKSNDTACYCILGQIISRRSQQAPDFAAPMSLMWWASGCSREAIEILNNIGLSKSFDTVQKLIGSTANFCIADARTLAHGPDGYMFGYDNVNMSTSKFVEQCSSAPAKVQSGTYFIIYPYLNPNPAALHLPTILLRAQNAPDLDFNNHLCPTFEQTKNSHHQFCSYVIRVLCRYEESFTPRQDELELQSPPRRALPDGHKTPQLPLKLCTLEESSIKGNLAAHVESHITQLHLTYAQLTKAVLSINDQATQSLNRGAKSIRAFDVNPFLRCQMFQLAIGLFHLCLNLVWGVLHVHRGHINYPETLAHLQHPDYHSLLAALMQILDGLILDAWRIECGYPSLAAYAASKPSSGDLRLMAAKILNTHATPTRTPLDNPDPTDTVRENTRRLIHDLMYVSEVTRAISAGDFGRVEDILSTLGMMFRGAGSKNYSTEIMHFTHNMKLVWKGTGFDDLVRDNIIINRTGVRGRGQGVDENMEHNIGRVKELFAAKGMYGSWDRLADISAAIDVIDSVKKSIAMSLDASYSGTGHTTPDTSNLVRRIANKARELKLNSFDSTRASNSTVKASVDILSAGEAVLKSASLATFNKNRRALLRGIPVEEEEGVYLTFVT